MGGLISKRRLSRDSNSRLDRHLNRGQKKASVVLFDIMFGGTIAQLTFAKLFLFGTFLIERMTIGILLDLPDSGINRSLDFANNTGHRNHLKNLSYL